jgi:hypothetical protein
MNLAYIAGLIDADGSIGFTSSKSGLFVPRIIITNTNLQILEDVKKVFGGNIQKLCSRKEKWKQAYYWQISNSSAVYFISKIEKWLRIKKENAWLLFAWDFIRPGRNKKRTPEIIDAFHLLNDQSKWLNFRGIGRDEKSPMDKVLEQIF